MHFLIIMNNIININKFNQFSNFNTFKQFIYYNSSIKTKINKNNQKKIKNLYKPLNKSIIKN